MDDQLVSASLAAPSPLAVALGAPLPGAVVARCERLSLPEVFLTRPARGVDNLAVLAGGGLGVVLGLCGGSLCVHTIIIAPLSQLVYTLKPFPKILLTGLLQLSRKLSPPDSVDTSRKLRVAGHRNSPAVGVAS